jgi:hypothetical protein
VSTQARQVAAAVRAVRDLYTVGRQSLAARPGRGPYGERAAEDEARRAGLHPDTLRKARAFADPVTGGYTPGELDELCRAVRVSWETFTARGARFGRTHVLRLLGVPKAGGRRAAVQRAMFACGWSTAELEAAIARRQRRRREAEGRRRAGGRRPGVGDDRRGLLARLGVLCESWRRLADELTRRVAARERPSRADLAGVVGDRFDRATRAVGELQTTVGQLLET